jgi:hypothetical protein
MSVSLIEFLCGYFLSHNQFTHLLQDMGFLNHHREAFVLGETLIIAIVDLLTDHREPK